MINFLTSGIICRVLEIGFRNVSFGKIYTYDVVLYRVQNVIQNDFCTPSAKPFRLGIELLILIYLSTAIGLTPGGSTHLHINNT
jgi:hypothetical protein